MSSSSATPLAMQVAIWFCQPGAQPQLPLDPSRTSISSGTDGLRDLDGVSTSKTGHFGRWAATLQGAPL